MKLAKIDFSFLSAACSLAFASRRATARPQAAAGKIATIGKVFLIYHADAADNPTTPGTRA
jgi:hypothetical protein